MYHPRQQGHSQQPSGSRHVSALSQDTTASGIADSTISNGDSLRLSHFPQPPASIPTTPISRESGTPSPSRSAFNIRTAPLVPQRRPLPVPTAQRPPNPYPSNAPPRNGTDRSDRSAPSALSQAPPSRQDAVGSSKMLHRDPVSPFDWHDGASSIGMDPTEDRLLSTSFITSLLQESKRDNTRHSVGSDALSGFSEMTYPPLASSYPEEYTQLSRYSPSVKKSSQRPPGGRPPPSSFMPIPESSNRLSGDSETLYMPTDHQSTMMGAARPGIQGTAVVGVASATMHNVSTNKHRIPYDGSPYTGGLTSGGFEANFPSPGVNTRFLKENSATPQTRESMHSAKSAAPSFMSRISSLPSIRRVLTWRKVKPLPPVPLIPHIPVAAEIEHRKADESKSLPDLVNRAGALQGLLEKGYHPHHSINSYYANLKSDGLLSGFDDTDTISPGTNPTDTPPPNRNHKPPGNLRSQWRRPAALVSKSKAPKKRTAFIVLGIFLVVALVAVGTAVGINVGRRSKVPSSVCPDSFVGASCNLNSTCVCTSSLPGQCDGLAQSVIDLIPALNQNFRTNLTSASVYSRLWLVQGAAPRTCGPQSLLLDVAPLSSETQPNVTLWAQTALFWNLVESQDLKATATLQKFIQKAPWKSLGQSKEISSSFSTSISGYTFNFATQEVQQPSASFVAVGQPTAAQLSRVGSVAHSVLDRMYSFASAASTQHQIALETYWTMVLKQELADLAPFKAAFSVSPILLPFDANLSQDPQSISKLLNSTTSPFPPPLSCFPGLKPAQSQQVNTIENGVFGLPPISNASQFNPTCYPDRPIYGVLDVLRLRLPFTDSRPGVPRQAAVLTRDVSPRALLHSGAILSPLPGPSNVTTITAEESDPNQYGTFGQSNHVILHYLSSIPDINVAIALVNYVLSSASIQAAPPTNTSILFQSLTMIPAIEVIIFGSIFPSDVSSAVSSFTTSSGNLFFGTTQGTALRNWVISGCDSTLVWAESALSPLVVRDNDFSDDTFNKTWTAVSTALQNGIANVGLPNITESFTIHQKFSPS